MRYNSMNEGTYEISFYIIGRGQVMNCRSFSLAISEFVERACLIDDSYLTLGVMVFNGQTNILTDILVCQKANVAIANGIDNTPHTILTLINPYISELRQLTTDIICMLEAA